MNFAGIESGRKLYDLQRVSVGDIVARALAEFAVTLESEGWQVERRIEPELPATLADPHVLEGAVKNLLQNSLKYAGGGKWLGIFVEKAGEGKDAQLCITVADHGPGIDSADLPHIFEPFYRGRNQASRTAAPGVGLGLSLVERHLRMMGGKVTVRTAEGNGAAFTLHLPVASQV